MLRGKRKFLQRFFYGPAKWYERVGAEVTKYESHDIVSFRKLALATLALPLGGFTFCVIWSLAFDFVTSTSTHCNVPNYLPSVSASIGSFSPQKYVWRITIALHTTPRYLVSFVYFKQIHSSIVLFTLNCVEISSLLGLSIVSSIENFVIHATCFLLFITSSFVGTFIHLFHDNLWSQFKRNAFCVNTVSWILALFFYTRHNQFCEAGMYTLFAAAEYIFVVSNMFFHFQAYHDFSQLNFSTSRKNLDSGISKFSV